MPDALRRCPRCLRPMKEVAGRYYCEACGEAMPAEPETQAETPAEPPKAEPQGVLLSWDDLQDPRLSFVHPLGARIPPRSVLVVKEGQTALYRVGGEIYEFCDSGLYPAFYETRTEHEILENLYEAEEQGDLPTQVDTALVFFSTRPVDLRFAPESALPVGGSGFYALPRLHVQYRIARPQQALHSLAGLEADEKDDPLAGRWRELLERLIPQALGDLLNERWRDRVFQQADAARRLAGDVSAWYAEEGRFLLEQAVNRELERLAEGIAVTDIGAEWLDAVLSEAEWSRRREALMPCPACGGWIDRLLQDRRCPKCGEVVHWCRAESRHLPMSGRRQCPYCYKTILL